MRRPPPRAAAIPGPAATVAATPDQLGKSEGISFFRTTSSPRCRDYRSGNRKAATMFASGTFLDFALQLAPFVKTFPRTPLFVQTIPLYWAAAFEAF